MVVESYDGVWLVNFDDVYARVKMTPLKVGSATLNVFKTELIVADGRTAGLTTTLPGVVIFKCRWISAGLFSK